MEGGKCGSSRSILGLLALRGSKLQVGSFALAVLFGELGKSQVTPSLLIANISRCYLSVDFYYLHGRRRLRVKGRAFRSM